MLFRGRGPRSIGRLGLRQLRPGCWRADAVLIVVQGMGVVTRLGEGVSAFRTGQRVVGLPWSTKVGDGSWQQYAVVPEAALMAVPDAVSDEAAAQYAVNPVTAYGLIDVRT